MNPARFRWGVLFILVGSLLLASLAVNSSRPLSTVLAGTSRRSPAESGVGFSEISRSFRRRRRYRRPIGLNSIYS